MKFFAVIDTNVLVSYLLTRRNDSSVAKVMELVKEGTIVPLLHAANHQWNICQNKRDRS